MNADEEAVQADTERALRRVQHMQPGKARSQAASQVAAQARRRLAGSGRYTPPSSARR